VIIIEETSMARVTIYSTATCPICERAKTMLSKWNIEYQEVAIDTDANARREFAEATHNAKTVPQIIIDGKLIGGFSELTELHMDGELDNLMQQASS